jgi:hypothetical protein
MATFVKIDSKGGAALLAAGGLVAAALVAPDALTSTATGVMDALWGVLP